MHVLVINAGSSSLKFGVFAFPASDVLLRGEIADSGGDRACVHISRGGVQEDLAAPSASIACDDASTALRWLASYLGTHGGFDFEAVGHRVVHGGLRFTEAALVDAEVCDALAALDDLAPLHNPASRRAIDITRRLYPDVPQVAVFDTAFHSGMPRVARSYALPMELERDYAIRRFGFHGTSHRYLARRTAKLLHKPQETLRLITFHLGNGASVAAIREGRSIDTSMGFTPLEGLVMGSRSGDLDASIPLFLQQHAGLTAAEVSDLLNRRSGLQALAGSGDMREIERRRAASDAEATLAFEMFCYRAKKYLGAYAAALGRLDAIVFSGGIGQHSAAVRAAVCADLDLLGIDIDPNANADASADCFIHSAHSRTPIAVIATDEEIEIARQTAERVAPGSAVVET